MRSATPGLGRSKSNSTTRCGNSAFWFAITAAESIPRCCDREKKDTGGCRACGKERRKLARACTFGAAARRGPRWYFPFPAMLLSNLQIRRVFLGGLTNSLPGFSDSIGGEPSYGRLIR